MKVLWICCVWPEPASSAAGVRTWQLLKTFQAQGWEVHACSPSQPNEHRDRLDAEGIPTSHQPPNDTAFDAYCHTLAPDLVVFDRFMLEEQFSWRVRAATPRAMRVLDTCDLHSLRRGRQARVEARTGESPAEPGTGQISDDAIRELAAIHRCDLSLVVSDAEQTLLLGQYQMPAERIAHNPLFVPDPEAGPEYDERRDFVTIGNFRHPPNLDAYRELHRDGWARIRARLPEALRSAELHVYGAYPTKEIMALDNPKTGFRVKGWAPEVRSTLRRYRVNLAPLRFGAGIKGKILEGWAVGTPCVTTPVGAEGMRADSGRFVGGIAIDDAPLASGGAFDAEAFAAAAADLYSDRARWEQARHEARVILHERFDPRRVTEDLLGRLRVLHADLDGVRQRNVVGAILWHQQLRATEYFSRWIETKERRLQHPAP